MLTVMISLKQTTRLEHLSDLLWRETSLLRDQDWSSDGFWSNLLECTYLWLAIHLNVKVPFLLGGHLPMLVQKYRFVRDYKLRRRNLYLHVQTVVLIVIDCS